MNDIIPKEIEHKVSFDFESIAVLSGLVVGAAIVIMLVKKLL